MRAFIVSVRERGSGDTHIPWSYPHGDQLRPLVRQFVIGALDPQSASRVLGLERYYRPSTVSFERYKAGTIAIPADLFGPVDTNDVFWSSVLPKVASLLPADLKVLVSGPLHLFLPVGWTELVLQLEEVPIVLPEG